MREGDRVYSDRFGVEGTVLSIVTQGFINPTAVVRFDDDPLPTSVDQGSLAQVKETGS